MSLDPQTSNDESAAVAEQHQLDKQPNLVERVFSNRWFMLALLVGALAWAAISSIWLFILIMAIVLSVVLHELGHFLVAKRNGMKVTEFFLGFGPRLWSTKKGETEYGLKLIPAGAYVRIIGMHSLEEVNDEENRTYRAKSYWQRMPVVAAGPAMNIVLGFLLLIVVFVGFGHQSDTRWKIDSVSEASAAQAAGLQPGDEIVAFGDESVGRFSDFSALIRTHAGSTVDLTVRRDGQEIVLPATIGWSLTNEGARPVSPLVAGDRITAVNGVATPTYSDAQSALVRTLGPATITFDRNGRSFTTKVNANGEGQILLPPDGYRGFLGISPSSVIVRDGVVSATGRAVDAFGQTVTGTFAGIGRIFSPSGIKDLASQVANGGEAPADSSIQPVQPSSGNNSGPSTSSNADRPMSLLGIVNVGAQLGEQAGWAGVLALLATVNIFLGLVNLLPLLPFDGGHIAVATYEAVREKITGKAHRVNMAKLMPVTYVVVLLMVGLFASTLYLDAVDPVRLSP